MGLIETEETNQFTFEAFAAHAFYTEINRSLVRQALAPLLIHPINQAHTIVDMACGTGSVTRLIAEETADYHRSQQTRIVGVDPSAEALRLAQKSLEEMGSKADFFQGEAENLASIVQNVDAAFFCNAIHLIINKLDALQFTSSSINLMPFFKWLPFLLPEASWPVIVLFMMEPI